MNALVTGASRGIGRAVAEELVRRGRKVVISAKSPDALDAMVAQQPEALVPIAIDLSEHGAAAWLAEEAERRVGPIAELVCAAGLVRYAAAPRVRELDLRDQLELNFVSTFLLAQAVGQGMQRRGSGSIVALTSTLANCHAPQTSAYAGSKAALAAALRTLALELAPAVRVNLVAPGVIDTDMVRVGRGEGGLGSASEELESLRQLHPLGRLGHASEVAEAVCFALGSTFMTGSVLTIDGGLSLK